MFDNSPSSNDCLDTASRRQLVGEVIVEPSLDLASQPISIHSLCSSINMTNNPFSSLIIAASLAVIASGCNSHTKASPVDPTLARSTLKSVLESWQRGESIDSWQSKQPPVVVQDFDWKAGTKLSSFEIFQKDETMDANLFCQVKLTMQNAQSQQSDRLVTYIVGTSPVFTVFRSLTP